jgi:pimeloyl-ACP methyl ester carboxylesterase
MLPTVSQRIANRGWPLYARAVAGAGQAFRAAAVEYVDTGSADIAYRRFGDASQRPLLMIHGWPLSGFTWRHCLPGLARSHSCIVTDTPGAGDTRWRADHAFSFRGQAEAYARFVDKLGLASLDVIAHDTGATIARELALILGDRVRRLVLIGTEMPGHRPPWIPMFQRAARLPGAAASFAMLLRSRRFRRSSLGFGGCFADLALLDGEFHDAFVRPLLDDRARLVGQLRYLRGIDWALVDSLATRHRDIAARTLLIWGADDPVFPIARARAMIGQLARCDGLVEIAGAKLLVHEERPEAVVEAASRLLG